MKHLEGYAALSKRCLDQPIEVCRDDRSKPFTNRKFGERSVHGPDPGSVQALPDAEVLSADFFFHELRLEIRRKKPRFVASLTKRRQHCIGRLSVSTVGRQSITKCLEQQIVEANP